MPAPKKKPSVVRTTASVYHLDVVLCNIEPPVWRRLQVPGDANLGWLHAALQVSMGWTNSHLHQFHVGERTYSDPDFELDEYDDEPRVLDENKVTLREVAPRKKSVLVYQYDFGDSWEHLIAVEKKLDADPTTAAVAQCLDGARACPPDDCGGTRGYEDLLQILAEPDHEEHESMLKWLGGSFDPEAFDREKVNKYLRKLKWPHTTVEQLAKVLMQRDSSKG